MFIQFSLVSFSFPMYPLFLNFLFFITNFRFLIVVFYKFKEWLCCLHTFSAAPGCRKEEMWGAWRVGKGMLLFHDTRHAGASCLFPQHKHSGSAMKVFWQNMQRHAPAYSHSTSTAHLQ
uniref:Uncharacterized protein n=1 Tax=Dunaliella tertiolecta TaxID=3047 RepID=A0A7S3QKB9_DUNTE